MDNRILCLGGAGYIGGAITDIFKEMDGDVSYLVYDSLYFERDFRKDVPFCYGDIRDKNRLKKVIEQFNPTAIIFLAARVGDGACQEQPEQTISINQKAVKWLSEHYDGRIVFCSTASVYGKNDHILNEDSELNPLSLYAVTKVEAEKHLIKKNAVIFRLGTLYGISDEFSRIRFDLVINLLSMKAIRGEPLTVFGGEQWRPLLHVKDAALAIVRASMNYNGSGWFPRGVYNICEKNMTICEVAEQIKETAEEFIGKVKIEYSDISFEDARNYQVDCTRYNSIKGHIKFTHTVKEGAREIMRLILEGRIKDPMNNVFNNKKYTESVKKCEQEY